MREIKEAGNGVILDEEGFLIDENKWNHKVAQEIAKQLGFSELDEEQLEIIDFLRSYYLKFHAFPILNYVCKHVGQPRKCLNNEFINPIHAWKIAGLPKLDGVHFVTFDGKHYRMEEYC